MCDECYEAEELFDRYLDHKRMWHFESEKGIVQLNTIAKDLGYRDEPFKYGSPIEQFLVDNPGAMEAIVTWIRANMTFPEWQEAIKAQLPNGGESEDDDE